MEFFRIQRDIPFMRHALVFNVISLVTFLVLAFLAWRERRRVGGVRARG